MTNDERRLFDAFVEERKRDTRSPEDAPVDGISPRNLRRYIVDGVVPSRLEPATRVAMARYVASRGVEGFEHLAAPPATNGNGGDLSRQVDDILQSDADDLTKTARLVDLWGIYRQKAISDVAELIRGDREILLLRAEAVRDLTRTARLEVEQAARREDRLNADRADDAITREALRRLQEDQTGHGRSDGEKTTGIEGSGDHPPPA